MSEWKEYTVQDLIDQGMLAEPMDGNHGSIHPKSSDYVSEGVPFIMANDLVNGVVDLINCSFISEKQAKTLKKGFAHPNDVLLTHKATIGRTAIVPNKYETIILTPQVTYYRVLKGIDNRYLKYYFDSDFFQNTLRNWAGSGSTRAYIGITAQRKLPIILPPLNVQTKIATVLSLLDEKISLNIAINENLHQLIAAYYAEIFKECEHTAKISDYADRVFSGGTPTTSNESYWSGEFKWLSSGETSQKYIVDTEKTITQAGVDNSSTRLAKKYDTVIASAGQGHTRGQTSMLLTDTYINQSIIVVESERIYMPFIYWNICGRYEELRVISNSNSIRGSLTTKMISAFTAPKADITQISRFSELAWAAIHEIEKNCNEIARLAALRDTLLPKLMNGEIDVSEVKI